LGKKRKSDGVNDGEGWPSAKCSGGSQWYEQSVIRYHPAVTGLCFSIDSYTSQWILMGAKSFCPGNVNFRWHFFLCPFFQYGVQCSIDAGKGVLSAVVNTLATW